MHQLGTALGPPLAACSTLSLPVAIGGPLARDTLRLALRLGLPRGGACFLPDLIFLASGFPLLAPRDRP